MDAINRLVDHWRQYAFGSRPGVHPADQQAVNGVIGLHLGAEPYPFVGDVLGADIWFLMLNSNVGDADAADEAQPRMAGLLRRNLSQDWEGVEYPFLSLDPALRHTGTYSYYNQRCAFGQLIDEFGNQADLPSLQARRVVATRVAVLQYYPYRSKANYPGDARLDLTPSTRLAVAAVHEALAQGRLLLVPRSAPKWGFDYGVVTGNLVTHRSDQARSPSVKPSARGGRMAAGDALLSRLLSGPFK
jgi:hypothetical protein